MNATKAAPSSPAVADPGVEARNRLLKHLATYNSMAQRPQQQLATAHQSFSACCGAVLVNKDGHVCWGGATNPETVRQQKGNTQFWGPLGVDNAEMLSYARRMHHKAAYGRIDSISDALYTAYMNDLANTFTRANKTAVILGVGIEKDKLIAAAYSPDHELYGKVEALQITDKDDGVMSLVWTNA